MTPQFEENYHELVAISWIIRKLSKREPFVQRWTPLCNFCVTVIKKYPFKEIYVCITYIHCQVCWEKKFPNYICHLKYKSNLESGKIFFWLSSRCHEVHALKMRPLNSWWVHKNCYWKPTYTILEIILTVPATENLSCRDDNFSRKKWKLTMRDEKEISKGKEEDECGERRWEEEKRREKKRNRTEHFMTSFFFFF